MKIAVEGCAHGELEKIYETIQGIENAEQIKIDLVICCGDFQSTRNLADLQTMAVPKKYRDMCSFYKYYSGELVAPILTIFIGGNHEASNYLQELPYGGWVAPNIYYLGYAGVVRVNGVRIAGISGIYKGNDFMRGHYEYPPYNEQTARSVYHTRQLEVFRLKQLSGDIDICISHDWPRNVYNYGNKAQLLRFKPAFASDMQSGQLGSRSAEELLHALKPKYWFSAHMHCKFSALVPHDNRTSETIETKTVTDNEAPVQRRTPKRLTKFLALDKCLPRRRFLQVLDIESSSSVNKHTQQQNTTSTSDNAAAAICFEYDAEWLAILYTTNHLISVKNAMHYMPASGVQQNERYNFTPTDEELKYVKQKFDNDLTIPKNFCQTVAAYQPQRDNKHSYCTQPKAQINPQCKEFCDRLGIDDPLSLALLINGQELKYAEVLQKTTNEEIKITDDCVIDNDDVDDIDDDGDDVDDDNSGKDDVDDDDEDDECILPELKNKSYEHKHVVSNVLKRKSLELPKPLLLDKEETDESLHNTTTETDLNSSQELCASPPAAVVSLNDMYDETPGTSGTTTPRKFKRRNEKIYNSNN